MSAAKIMGQNMQLLRRHRSRMSQEALADLARINRGHVSDLEQGKHNPQLDTIERIAEALGVLPHQLLDPGLRDRLNRVAE